MAQAPPARSSLRKALLAVALAGTLPAATSEPAAAATTFTVNQTGDASDSNISDNRCDTSPATGRQCTLRAAIEESNDTPGVDAIEFNITTPGAVKTIAPASPLPPITDTISIDGYTQPGASPNTLATGNDAVLKIQLNGANAGAFSIGLSIQTADSTVKGLVVNRFEHGIRVESGHTGNSIEGNFIGTNVSGTRALGNLLVGVSIGGPDNAVGGTAPAARNVVSGNDLRGVRLAGSVATGNRVEGNHLGTNAKGTAALGNGSYGVGVEGGATNNTIGGTAAGAGNVISGNEGDGVLIFGGTTGNNNVEGNRIGPNAAGTADLGNGRNGVHIFDSDQNTIGGTTSGAGNAISGNGEDGVLLVADDNTVQGNAIRASGDDGVDISRDGNTIGGGNVILANGGNGVEVSDSGQGNSILSNQIFGNTALGIDLVGGFENGFNVTANDTDDPDAGANNLQNFPVITSAIRSSSNGLTTIAGTLNSNPSQSFTIQCFLATDGDPSNHGEGFLFVAVTTTSTNAGGDSSFACVTPIPQAGQEVSATATNTATGNTSEFSENRVVVPGP